MDGAHAGSDGTRRALNRLLLLIVLGLLVWYYFPDTRAMLMDVARPVVVPVVERGAKEEMAQIGRNVVEHERLTGRMPSVAEWLGWLDYRYPSEDMKHDPWGSVYQLEVEEDSVAIVSFGPDRTRGTPDDLRVASPRH